MNNSIIISSSFSKMVELPVQLVYIRFTRQIMRIFCWFYWSQVPVGSQKKKTKCHLGHIGQEYKYEVHFVRGTILLGWCHAPVLPILHTHFLHQTIPHNLVWIGSNWDPTPQKKGDKILFIINALSALTFFTPLASRKSKSL